MNAFLPFVQAFQAAIKATQLYGIQHPRYQEALSQAFGHLETLVSGTQEGRPLRIDLAHGRLFVGKVRQDTKQLHVGALVRQMDDRQLPGLIIVPGVTPEELQTLLLLFNMKPSQIQEAGGADRFLEEAGTLHIRILTTRLQEVGEDEDLVPVKAAADLLEQLAARGEGGGEGEGSGEGEGKGGGEEGSGSGAGPAAPPATAGLLRGFLTGIARGGMAPVDLTSMAAFLGQYGLPVGDPQTAEIVRAALRDLPAEQRVGVLRGVAQLPGGALRSALSQATHDLVDSSLSGAYEEGHVATEPLSRATEEVLALAPNPMATLHQALDALRQRGMSEEQIQEIMEIVTWDRQSVEERLGKLMDGEKLWELPQEKVLSFLRELLEGGRTKEFQKLMQRYATGLHVAAVGRRMQVAEGFERIANWVEVPGIPPDLLESLLEILRIHYGREKDPQVHAWTSRAMEALLWNWVQNGDPLRAEREWTELTDTVTEMSLPAPWKAQATADLRARLGNPERMDKVLAMMFLIDRESAAKTIHPFLVMLGGTAARHLAQSLADEQDRTHRGRLLEAMKAMGVAAAGPLLESLEAKEWFVVRNALNVLGEIGTEEQVPDVGHALNHPDPRVVRAAIGALWKLGGRQAEQLITGELKHPDPATQMEALFCLGEMKARNAALAIAELTKPPKLLQGTVNPKVRERAIETLGKLGTPFALDIFSDLLKRKGLFGGSTEPFEIRVATARALRFFGTPEALAILSKAVDREPKGTERSALEAVLNG